MFDFLTNGESVRDGIWTISTWEGKQCMWALNDIGDIRASIYDYEPKMEIQLKSAEELLRAGGLLLK